MKYLSRNKLYEKREPFKDARKIYIFCEGDKREIDYFNFFRGFSSNIDIIPIPSDNGNTEPVKLKNSAIKHFLGDESTRPIYQLSKEYNDEVWFVIDTDLWNIGNKINILRDYVRERNNYFECWFVAQSNPSFEIWLYYHFHPEKPDPEHVSKHDSFKDYTNSKISGGFDSRKMPVWIQSAICNSETNFEIENGQPKLYSTEVHLLGKKIFEFTKEQIAACIEHMKKQS
ncbi:MAG: RloB domain-containing protein [Chitinispirillaceae bacterium]|nr:RloB domain-containing protein [Chitinispirillaceae bacterium]